MSWYHLGGCSLFLSLALVKNRFVAITDIKRVTFSSDVVSLLAFSFDEIGKWNEDETSDGELKLADFFFFCKPPRKRRRV